MAISIQLLDNGRTELCLARSLCESVFVSVLGDGFQSTPLSRWQKKLSSNGFIVGAFLDGRLVSCALAYERCKCIPVCKCGENTKSTDDDLGNKTMHIWMSATLPEARRKGCMRQLFDAIETEARKRKLTSISVHTSRNKFSDMYRFCESRKGMSKVGEEWTATGGNGQQKMQRFLQPITD